MCAVFWIEAIVSFSKLFVELLFEYLDHSKKNIFYVADLLSVTKLSVSLNIGPNFPKKVNALISAELSNKWTNTFLIAWYA